MENNDQLITPRAASASRFVHPRRACRQQLLDHRGRRRPARLSARPFITRLFHSLVKGAF